MTGLPICGYAVAGPGSEHAPAALRVDLPPGGLKRSGGRLPRLAVALAEAADPRSAPTPDEADAVLFGTGLGCLTETVAFVEHMITADEATPKPRAFAASVHNAIASTVALKRGARGECQTFVHGETSFAHALVAARRIHRTHPTAGLVTGGVDELSPYLQRAVDGCGLSRPPGEGGGLVRIGGGPVLAFLTEVRYGRPRDHEAFLLDGLPAEAATVAVPGLHSQPTPGATPPFDAVHPSLSATALALAVGILGGAVAPGALGLDAAPAAIALFGRSRFGDASRIVVEAADGGSACR